MTRAFDCVKHDKLWRALEDLGMSTQVGAIAVTNQEATVQIQYVDINLFKVEK